jgi:hypothetical protein
MKQPNAKHISTTHNVLQKKYICDLQHNHTWYVRNFLTFQLNKALLSENHTNRHWKIQHPLGPSRACGSIVVKALCYKPKACGFQSQRAELISSIYLILPATLGPTVYSASSRNEYQKQKNNVSGE